MLRGPTQHMFLLAHSPVGHMYAWQRRKACQELGDSVRTVAWCGAVDVNKRFGGHGWYLGADTDVFRQVNHVSCPQLTFPSHATCRGWCCPLGASLSLWTCNLMQISVTDWWLWRGCRRQYCYIPVVLKYANWCAEILRNDAQGVNRPLWL